MRVVLLHAFPLDPRMWEPQRELLAPHAVVAPKLYELGRGMGDWARAILDRVDGEFVAVGGSMGGYCALSLARLAPERLRGLVLAGARADADSAAARSRRDDTIRLVNEGGAAALWEQMRPRLFTAGADAAVVDHARAIALGQEPEALVRAVEAMRDREDSSAVVSSLAAPVLVVVGEEDPFFGADEARALVERGGGRQKLVVVPACGHLPNLERPEAFNRALGELLGAAA